MVFIWVRFPFSLVGIPLSIATRVAGFVATVFFVVRMAWIRLEEGTFSKNRPRIFGLL